MDWRGTAPLFLISLTAGYIFSKYWRFTRWTASRAEGQRLLFESAQWGTGLTLLSWMLFANLEMVSTDFKAWLMSLTADTPLLPVFLGALLLSLLLPLILNWCDSSAGRRVIDHHGSELDKLMLCALDKEMMVSVTLSNKKLYIGWPVETPEPHKEMEYVRISPAFSGYRGEDNQINISTQYLSVYKKIASENITDRVFEDFDIVIRSEEIVHANLYDSGLGGDIFKLEELKTDS